MSAANLLPLNQIAEALTEPLRRASQQLSQKQKARDIAEYHGAGLEEAIQSAAMLMNAADNEHLRAKMAMFFIKEVHGVGSDEGNSGPTVIFNIKGDGAKIASVLNPNRETIENE